MDTAQAKMFVSSLNNSTAKILFAFLFAGTALDVQDLREWTGLKRATIYEALAILKGRSIVDKQTLAHGRDLWLPAGNLLPGFQVSEKGTSELQESTKGTPVSTTTTTSRGDKLINKSVVAVAGEESKKWTPAELAKAARQAELEEFGIPVQANLKACKIFGIGEPMASKISEMKHVTPQFIEAHVRSLVDGETKGLAIVRIRSDETPRLWVDELLKDGVPSLAEWHEARQALKQEKPTDVISGEVMDDEE